MARSLAREGLLAPDRAQALHAYLVEQQSVLGFSSVTVFDVSGRPRGHVQDGAGHPRIVRGARGFIHASPDIEVDALGGPQHRLGQIPRERGREEALAMVRDDEGVLGQADHPQRRQGGGVKLVVRVRPDDGARGWG